MGHCHPVREMEGQLGLEPHCEDGETEAQGGEGMPLRYGGQAHLNHSLPLSAASRPKSLSLSLSLHREG